VVAKIVTVEAEIVLGVLPPAGVVMPVIQGGVQGGEVRIAKRVHETPKVAYAADTLVAV
jgi:hypothetical protein